MRGVGAVLEPWSRGGRSLGLLLTLSIGTAGCHALPPLAPLGAAESAALRARCSALFPAGRWEATHVVEASLPLGQETTLLGVIAARKAGDGFRSVLLSQEGLVLLDSTYAGGKVTTHRAVPPLDREGFDAGMAGDIRLVLFPPEGELTAVGSNAGGVPACRFREAGGVVEVALSGPREHRIRRFDGRNRVVREARLEAIDACGFARETVIESRGLGSYRLHLSLVERSPSGCPETR